jgi:SAM-dependent methyltransferase
MMTSGGAIVPKDGFHRLPSELVQRYLWVSQFVKGKAVLDAGCGYGYGAHYLSEGIADRVTGIDSDSKAIRYASRHYHNSQIDFRLMDATLITFPPDSFDVVISFEVIEHLREAEAFMKGVSTVLKPSGSFVLSTPNKDYTVRFYKNGLPPNRLHCKEYTPRELAELVGQFFTNLRVFAEFNDSNIDPTVEKLTGYVESCRIPYMVRRFVPKGIKNYWLRMKGYPEIPREMEYRIEELESIDQLNPRYPVQLMVCQKE